MIDLKMWTSMLTFKLWIKQEVAEQEQIIEVKDSIKYKCVALKNKRKKYSREVKACCCS